LKEIKVIQNNWRGIFYLWLRRIVIGNMKVLPKLICSINYPNPNLSLLSS
jgi:hypothetical protein